MRMYGECEDEDHYYRDGCVWDNEIDSFDTSSVQVQYDNGTQLTYTLNAFLPYEGQRISFTGEKGRLDVRLNYRQPWEVEAPFEFRLTKNREVTRSWNMKPARSLGPYWLTSVRGYWGGERSLILTFRRAATDWRSTRPPMSTRGSCRTSQEISCCG